jgi:hypothetical protein
MLILLGTLFCWPLMPATPAHAASLPTLVVDDISVGEGDAGMVEMVISKTRSRHRQPRSKKIDATVPVVIPEIGVFLSEAQLSLPNRVKARMRSLQLEGVSRCTMHSFPSV